MNGLFDFLAQLFRAAVKGFGGSSDIGPDDPGWPHTRR
jgi:hypothetical protein